jgi:hypothetical protein
MIKVIHNSETGEKVEIELTADEIKEVENRAQLSKQEEAKKTALLERLGITEEEAKLLLS